MDYVIDSGNCRISYSVQGPLDAPVLLLSNSIGTTRELWARQAPAFSRSFRLVLYDTRGHGDSTIVQGEYSLEQLGLDALAVLDAVGARTAHVCGLSLGGITAMWLGVNAPDRVASLVLSNTASRIGSTQSWTERISFVREQGMTSLAERSMPVWFSSEFRERDPESVYAFRAMLKACAPGGYLGCCAALRDADLRDAIGGIRCPTLLIAGSEDTSTTVEQAEFTRSRVAGSRLATIPAAHLSNIEEPETFTTMVLEFLDSRRTA